MAAVSDRPTKRAKTMKFSTEEQSEVYDTPFSVFNDWSFDFWSAKETRTERKTIWIDPKMILRYSPTWKTLVSSTKEEKLSEPMKLPCGYYYTWNVIMKLFENNLNSDVIFNDFSFDGADVIRTLEWLQVDKEEIIKLFERFYTHSYVRGSWEQLPSHYMEHARKLFLTKKNIPTKKTIEMIIRCFGSHKASSIIAARVQ